MDPNNKKDQKNNQNRNRNMRGVVTLIIWALVLTVVFNYINAYSNNLTKRASSHEIPYSQLIDLIQEDQVAELKIENGVLYATPVDGYVYTEEATDKNKEPKSYTQSEKTPLILYTTALNDASLLPLLEEHNVKYTSPVQTQMSPILEFMITYVLPVIVLAALFMLVMRIMAKNGGIGGIGSVSGSVLSAFLVTASKEWWLRFFDQPLTIGGWQVPLFRTGFRMVIFSILLMAVVLFYRRGIMGNSEFSWDGVARLPGRIKGWFSRKRPAHEAAGGDGI